MELFADIIIDISHNKLDQTFQYRIPSKLQNVLEPGSVVEIPFGRGDRLTKGCDESYGHSLLPSGKDEASKGDRYRPCGR